jgi:hypothetical protein
MRDTPIRRVVRLTAAMVTGGIALTGFAGVVGLIGGGLSFGAEINTRLPFGSLVLAGLALLVFVAIPMTIAAVAAERRHATSGDLVFASGLLLVMWIAVQLAFIQAYSWFHPTYLGAAVVVLGLGWLMNRLPSAPSDSAWGRRWGVRQGTTGRQLAASGPSSVNSP